MYPLWRKIKTVARNPRVVADKAAAAAIDLVWSGARKNRLLSTWHAPNLRSRLEDIVFDRVFGRWIEEEYLVERDPDRREALKDRCMAGQSGVAWAEVYDQTPIDRSTRYGDLSFDEAFPWFSAMDDALESASTQTLVVQIGCSSGREMDYFARRFPRISFVGTDIDEAITARAARRHAAANLSFRVCRAHRLIDSVPSEGPLILYTNGSLNYVQPEHVMLMFHRMHERGNAMLILGESWRPDGPAIATSLSRWRGSFSFSHDYKEYASLARLKIMQARLIQTHTDPSSPHFKTRSYHLQAAA